jgi:hypothetical protein
MSATAGMENDAESGLSHLVLEKYSHRMSLFCKYRYVRLPLFERNNQTDRKALLGVSC